MDTTQQNVALLVHSCDRYTFLFKGFEYFFSKYWDYRINCNYYFATEEIDATISGFHTIKSGKGEWSDRLAFLLKEKISENYVLYFQEDMWLTKKVNSTFFNHLFDTAIENKWKQVKLNSSDVYTTKETNLYIEGFNVAEIDNSKSDFLMSHQATLWQKGFLIDQLLKNEHPWRNERRGTKRLKKLNPVIFHTDYFAENSRKEINKNNEPILRSGYQTVSTNGMLNHNIESYIKELREDNSEYQDYAEQLEYNYNNELTHDGKPKPRKVGVFKRAKNWLKGK